MPGLEAFDALVARAERAAASFDPAALTEAVVDLGAFMDQVDQDAQLDRAALSHMRKRLTRYRNLCQFLQQTLHQTLVGALSQSSPARYGPQGAPAPAGPLRATGRADLPPLIRRYC